jgi:hypothetical protein
MRLSNRVSTELLVPPTHGVWCRMMSYALPGWQRQVAGQGRHHHRWGALDCVQATVCEWSCWVVCGVCHKPCRAGCGKLQGKVAIITGGGHTEMRSCNRGSAELLVCVWCFMMSYALPGWQRQAAGQARHHHR